MMKVLLIIFLISPVLSNSQNLLENNKIDYQYRKYLKTIFEPTFLIEESKKYNSKNSISGTIRNDSTFFQITNTNSFTVSSDKSNEKLMAAILYGIKNFAHFDFLADDFGHSKQSKEFVMKELLKIKIYAIPDTNTMTLKRSYNVNKLEKIQQYSIGKKILLKDTILITYYTNQYENETGLNKNIKTIIQVKDKIIYSSTKDGHKTTISKNNFLNNHQFIYKHNEKIIVSNGGLFSLILNNYLKNIKEEAHRKAINISNVKDFYRNQDTDLKRVSNRGRLFVKSLTLNELLSKN
jgi:hypothetical protein